MKTLPIFAGIWFWEQAAATADALIVKTITQSFDGSLSNFPEAWYGLEAKLKQCHLVAAKGRAKANNV